MLVDFSAINFDKSGGVEYPLLILKTLYGEKIGYLGLSTQLKLNIKFNEMSEISFDYPSFYVEDGRKIKLPEYDKLTGMMIVEAKPYGQFLLMKPEVDDDGLKKVKHCNGYSLEYELNNKKIYIPSGTYNFYNTVDSKDTILGVVSEIIPNWSLGTVPSTFIGKYRTFDQVDENLYSFMMNTLQKAYNCFFVFDTNTRTINVIDADQEAEKIPIYLSFENLIKSIKINEMSDDIVSSLSVYGADPVSIRKVNPIGTNKIYNLDWFIEQGNFPISLTSKWNSWKATLASKQPLYSNLIVQRDVELANLTSQKATLTKLQKELFVLEQLQSGKIEGISYGKATQAELDQVNADIVTKKAAISAKEQDIKLAEASLAAVNSEQEAINTACAFSSFFTAEELKTLNPYFKEDSITESTFVLSTIDYSSENIARDLANYSVSITNQSINEIPVDALLKKRLFDFRGGKITLSKDANVFTADIKQITLEYKTETNEFLFTCFLNSIKDTFDGVLKEYPSGDLTLKGSLFDFVKTDTDISFTVESCMSFLQFGVTEYQQISVEKELYEYATDILKKMSQPTYEFSVESGNLIFAKDFEPFKNALQLGKSVYLNLEEGNTIYPILLAIDIDYERPDSFSMVFNNKFKLKQGNSLVDLLGNSITTANSVNFNKFNYSAYKDSHAESEVKKFMDGALDAAKNQIVSSTDIYVDIGGNGINLKKWNDTKTDFLPQQIRMINNTMAFTDDNWASAKVAIGKFSDKNSGDCWGIVAPNIVGTLIAGNNMVLEADTLTNGVTQFKFDASGAFINNGRMYMQSAGGRIGFDPNYGILGGTANLFQVNDTGTMIPSCIDADGKVILENGFPKDTNFWLDINGKLYVRGTVYAESGYFQGIVQATDFQDQSGNSMLKNGKFDSNYLDLGNIQLNGETGDITMSGNINLSQGNINWGSNSPVKMQYSVDGSTAWHDVQTASDIYRREWNYVINDWGIATKIVAVDGRPGSDASVPRYITQSGITATTIQSPKIYAGEFYATDGSPTYAEMDNEGFSIYNTGVALPKAQLASKNDGSIIWFSLGAGSGYTNMSDRFVMMKQSNALSMYLYGTSGTNTCGFQFNSNGTIDVQGTLNANVTAVFA